jgi:hypothetical protein
MKPSMHTLLRNKSVDKEVMRRFHCPCYNSFHILEQILISQEED